MFKKKKKQPKLNVTFYREDGTSWKVHADVGDELRDALKLAKSQGATHFMGLGSKGGGFLKEIK